MFNVKVFVNSLVVACQSSFGGPLSENLVPINARNF